jgi:hypothetical protein
MNIVTNQWGVVTPYMINFRAFSAEIANVLAGIASSSNCVNVKGIFVSPSKALPPVAEAQPTQAPTPQYIYRPPPTMAPNPFMMRERGERGNPFSRNPDLMMRRPMPQAQPTPAQVAAPAVPAGPVIFLTENPLFVTLYIDVVNLKAPETPVAAARPKMAEH